MFMSEFVLVVLVTMGFTKDPMTFEIRLPKDSYKQCIKDSKSYKFPFEDLHRVISVKTSCERVILKNKSSNKGKQI
tara:strand:- start:42 stop:269 length:228 start_codon:yes stop_codon:yes gene_type:complete